MNDSPNESKRAQISNLCPSLTADPQQVEALFEILDRFGGFDAPGGELSIAFVSKSEISRIHEQFMQDPTATDVITFPGDSDEDLAGEICVCPEVALEYSESNQVEFSQELALYLVHGYLHLCGFNDETDTQRRSMRNAESIAMDNLARHQAIPQFRIAID